MHSSVPPGHKLIAVTLAAATAVGLYTFLSYRQAQVPVAASLSFDSAAAIQADPSLTGAPQAALFLGQSILSDSVIDKIVPQAHLGVASPEEAISQFRTRIELTQPSDALLQVRYRDRDPGNAAAITNAVAEALVAWAPANASALPKAANVAPAAAPAPPPAPAASPEPRAESIPAPKSARAPQQAPAAGPSLAAALGELQAQLSAADERTGPESPSRSEHEQQRYLEVQVRTAQQRLNDLRKEFAPSGAADGGQARLETIQHALALFWPSAAGLSTAGTSEKQFRYEREQLARDISIIEQQHKAAERAEAAQAATAQSAAANSAPANPVPQQAAEPPSQTMQVSRPQPAPPQTAPEATASSAPAAAPRAGAAPNPFHIQSLAGAPAPVVWWPSALIGCCCGLLYWGLAFVLFRTSREPDDVDDDGNDDAYTDGLELPPPGSDSIFGLSNAGDRSAVGSRGKWVERDTAERELVEMDPVETDLVQTSRRRRGAFIFDPEPGSATSDFAAGEYQPNTPEAYESLGAESVQGSRADFVDNLPDIAVSSAPAGIWESASDADGAQFPRSTKEESEALREKRGETADQVRTADRIEMADQESGQTEDPWEEEIRKALSQTTVAHMLDPDSDDEDATPAKGPGRAAGTPSSEHDRLAG